MRTRSKLLLAGLTAALMLAAAVSTASAGKLEVSDQDFRAEWTTLEFDADVGDPVICEVSLLGNFHSRTIAKVSRALIGAVTSAQVTNCGANTGATVLTETLPWHVTYDHFNGRLPNITQVEILLIGAAFRVQSNATCLVQTTLTEPAGGIINRDTTTAQAASLTANESRTIDITSGGFACFFSGDTQFRGTTTNLRAKDGGLLFIRLI